MKKPRLRRNLRYALETIPLLLAYLTFRLLPLDQASALGGWIGRHLGPLLSVQPLAKKNLARAMPELNEKEQAAVLHEMWDNLGRMVGEYPHLSSDSLNSRITISGQQWLEAALSKQTPIAFISGHLGNWEIAPKAAALAGMKLALIYRRSNSPFAEVLLRYMRRSYQADMHAKGVGGARHIIRAIRKHQPIALLVDQKMNTGIPVKFFGREAMTTPAIAHFALSYHLAILPIQVTRLEGAHFHVTIHPPLGFTPTGNKGKDVLDIMTSINQLLEEWIRQKPAQWFWVHNRWPKE